MPQNASLRHKTARRAVRRLRAKVPQSKLRRRLARFSLRIGARSCQGPYYHVAMLRYHVAFYLPKVHGDMVVAEALDFPGAVTQGFDLPDARLMISSALEDLAQALLE